MWFIPLDKVLHFTVSFCLTVCLNVYLPRETANKVAFSVGVGKEVWGHYHPAGKAELGDLAANVAGIILADKTLEAIRCNALTAAAE